MANALAIIPCKYTQKSKIYDCVKSIKQNVDADILVIDSNSEDRTYACNLGAPVEFIENINYDIGAYLSGYHLLPNYETYICIHDSFTFNAPFKPNRTGLSPFRTFEARRVIGKQYAIRGRKDALMFLIKAKKKRAALQSYGFDSAEQIDYFDHVCSQLHITPTASWVGIFGPMFTADNVSMSFLSQLLTREILPKNKYEQMGFERILGMVAQKKLQVMEPYWGEHFTTPLIDRNFSKHIINRT